MDFKFLDGQSNEEIKKYIDNSYNIDKIAFYLAKKGNLELIKYLIEEKELDVNSILENKYKKTFLMFACENDNLELVQYLIKQGADITPKNSHGKTVLFYARRNNNIIEYLIANIINLNDFNCFKSSIKELEECKITFKSIQKDEKKLHNQSNYWLEQQCNEKNKENIKFLLDYGANKEIIYNQIKSSIEQNNFDTFKFFVENFKKFGIILEEIRKEKELEERLQNRLNEWLEEKCNEKDEENIKFLLDCGATEIGALKVSIQIGRFKSFKYLVKKGENLLGEIRKEKEWEERLQHRLNEWLEERCNEEDEENIKFLLPYVNNGVIYNQIKISIEQNKFDTFKFFVEEFKGTEIILEEIRKEKEWEEKLQKQIEAWYISKFLQKENDRTEHILVKKLEEDIRFLERNFEIPEKVKNEACRMCNIKIRTRDRHNSNFRLTDDHGRIIP